MSRRAGETRINDLRREIAEQLRSVENRVLQLGEVGEAQASRISMAIGELVQLVESGTTGGVPTVERPAPEHPTPHPTPVIRARADTVSTTSRHGGQECLRNAELERVTNALERSKEDLQRFAYAASHDLQAPVRTITTYLQLLDRRLGDRLHADEREMIGYAQEASKRMHTLILDLLLYSRASTEPINFELVDGEELLNALMRGMRIAIKEAGTTVTWDRPLPALFVDSSAIFQVLQNLIGNAMKYRREETPRVHVSIVKEANHSRVCVRDNGQGIAPEHTKKVFEMLQRLHGNELPGSGIGLAICQRLVDRLGGKIWVDSEVGRGSTFCFTIPFLPPEATQS
ncbi:MAG: ATP-binding protein [Acidobacteriota bacterium]|nr:ATP-binding protein [Acidobacteriota bacterium]